MHIICSSLAQCLLSFLLQSPELEEEISLRLTNATGGATITTSGSQVATITVQASDHPYGLFTFSSAFRPLVVSEGVGEVEVIVTREFGDLGSVTVGYTTVESGHNYLEGRVDTTQLEQNRYNVMIFSVCASVQYGSCYNAIISGIHRC